MYQNAQTQQEAGRIYFAGMQWCGIELDGSDAGALNQYDIDIAKARAPEARVWLIQNKAEYMALMLDIKVVKVGYQSMRTNGLSDAELRRKASKELARMVNKLNSGEAIP